MFISVGDRRTYVVHVWNYKALRFHVSNHSTRRWRTCDRRFLRCRNGLTYLLTLTSVCLVHI